MDGLYDFAQVKRWNTKRVNFLRKDELFFPINTNDSHWSLVVVNPKKKTFTYYNSLNGDCDEHIILAIKNYLLNDATQWDYISIADCDILEWRVLCAESPKQKDGYSCGIYTLLNMFCLADDLPLTYEKSYEDDRQKWRSILAWFMTSKQIIDPRIKYIDADISQSSKDAVDLRSPEKKSLSDADLIIFNKKPRSDDDYNTSPAKKARRENQSHNRSDVRNSYITAMTLLNEIKDKKVKGKRGTRTDSLMRIESSDYNAIQEELRVLREFFNNVGVDMSTKKSLDIDNV